MCTVIAHIMRLNKTTLLMQLNCDAITIVQFAEVSKEE